MVQMVIQIFYYNLRIKPEKGKTLIWPAEWTHAHSGETLLKGKKYNYRLDLFSI